MWLKGVKRAIPEEVRKQSRGKEQSDEVDASMYNILCSYYQQRNTWRVITIVWREMIFPLPVICKLCFFSQHKLLCCLLFSVESFLFCDFTILRAWLIISAIMPKCVTGMFCSVTWCLFLLDIIEKAITRAGNITAAVESFFATGNLKSSETGLGLMQVSKLMSVKAYC